MANAYSGYITVKNGTNNLFFIFIEAENNDPKAPLMLWTPGGPGLPVLLSLLLQNGPVQLDAQGNLTRRELTIQKNMSVIYLDAPVGAGYSFTTNASGYATKLDDVTKDIKEFLQQFLELFKEYQQRDFYAGGDSYAAAVLPFLFTSLLARGFRDVLVLVRTRHTCGTWERPPGQVARGSSEAMEAVRVQRLPSTEKAGREQRRLVLVPEAVEGGRSSSGSPDFCGWGPSLGTREASRYVPRPSPTMFFLFSLACSLRHASLPLLLFFF
ncbi:putative serine carboxypeptidase CPVL [Amblyomma americanum]